MKDLNHSFNKTHNLIYLNYFYEFMQKSQINYIMIEYLAIIIAYSPGPGFREETEVYSFYSVL
jgi:hypothetical protein